MLACALEGNKKMNPLSFHSVFFYIFKMIILLNFSFYLFYIKGLTKDSSSAAFLLDEGAKRQDFCRVSGRKQDQLCSQSASLGRKYALIHQL